MSNPVRLVPEISPSAEVRSRRHRAVTLASFVERPTTSAQEADDREASRTISLLAEALEQIAATTTDAKAREVAEDVLALFQGC